MRRDKSTTDDPLSLEKEKRREGWGATCKFSRGNRRLPNSPIPLAPHLARDWNCWQESDESGDEEITLRSIDQYHRKISLSKRSPKSGVIRKKRDPPSSPLLIRSLSVCSQTPTPSKHSLKNSSPDLGVSTSPVARHGFRTIFSAKRAPRTGQYQWVQSISSERDYDRKVNNENENDISCLRVGSSPTLTVHRQPVSPANTVFSGNSLSHPATTLQFLGRSKPRTSATHLTLRPASSQPLPVHFHRPMSSHITGRAGLKSNFHPLTAKSSSLKQGEMLKICVKTEAIKCSSAPPRGSNRAQVPEPPAPSPLVPH